MPHTPINGYVNLLAALGVSASIAEWYANRMEHLTPSACQALFSLQNSISDALPSNGQQLTRKDSRRVCAKIASVCAGMNQATNVDVIIGKAMHMIDDAMESASDKKTQNKLSCVFDALLDMMNSSFGLEKTLRRHTGGSNAEY